MLRKYITLTLSMSNAYVMCVMQYACDECIYGLALLITISFYRFFMQKVASNIHLVSGTDE